MRIYGDDFIPRLRTDIEAISTSYQGKKALLVRDPLGLIEKPLLLQGEILEFIALMDGRRNIRDFQLEFIRMRGGVLVSSQEVEKLLSELDSAFLLDSERYRRERKRLIDEYSLLEVRQAFHAGRSYPAEAKELRIFLDSFFSSEPELPAEIRGKELIALVSPHIDLGAGRRVYARAYQALKNSTVRRVILIGTGHSLHDSFLSLTERDFETPLGRIKTDKDWVRRLREAGVDAVSADDIAHRSEHSLEFQLIFLQHLFGSNFSLIPILCGSFHTVLDKVSRPSDISGLKSFLEVLGLAAKEFDPGTLLVAGVDLSHIGPKFGHEQRASSLLYQAKNHDRLLIGAICKADVESFWQEMKKVKGVFNVCGFSALACLLEVLSGSKGFVLDYDFWQEESTQSAVSFAAIAFEKR